jgi:hypothetical protein
MKKIALAVFCGAFLLAAAGCGYRLGSLLPPTMKSVSVPNFKNYTNQPGIEAQVTNGVIERFQVDGTLQVLPHDEADTQLLGEIIDYKREGLTLSTSTDATTTYRLIIAVRLTFKDLKTGKVLWVANRIEGENTFPPGLSTPEAERAAVPGVVEDLAEHVVKKVVDAGW